MTADARTSAGVERARELLARGDRSAAFEAALAVADSDPSRIPFALWTLASHLLAGSLGLDDAALTRIAEFERRFAGKFNAEGRLLMADLLLAGGRRQEAAERYVALLAAQPGWMDVRRRLGLCELARALNERIDRTANLGVRWRRALAHLLTCASSDAPFREWAQRRTDAYGVMFRADHADGARKGILAKLDALLVWQINEAESQKHAASAEGLKQLRIEFQSEQSRLARMSEAMEFDFGALPVLDDGVPRPFGMLWYRENDAPAAAREFLSGLVARTDAIPRRSDGTGMLGVELRQWYSRLSLARHHLQWGNMPDARAALSSLCGQSAEGRIKPTPTLPVVRSSPRCCDPACESFAKCNPGYAGLPDAAAVLERDAHRLALDVEFALAGQCGRSGPSRFFDAGQHWLAAQQIAGVLGEAAAFEQRISEQGFDLLDHWSLEPATGIGVLETLLSVAPNRVVKGRLADRLLNEGIGRYNQRKWTEAVLLLTKACELQPGVTRGLDCLAAALQQVATDHLAAGKYDEARETLLEMQQMFQRARSGHEFTEQMNGICQWADEMLNLMDENSDDIA